MQPTFIFIAICVVLVIATICVVVFANRQTKRLKEKEKTK